MIRIAVAFSGEEGRQILCRMLETRGFSVRFRCRTGAEAIRAVKMMGGGTVVCAARLSDMSAGEIAEALGSGASVIAVGRPAQLEACGSAPFALLPVPLGADALAQAVQSALARDNDRVPVRSDGDREIVARAKALLMQRDSLTEPEAHRFLQRAAMARGVKMAVIARETLGEREGREGRRER